MNLKQLELVVAIADQRSFSRGAEMVHLVQSTASQHIKSLEDEFEIKLFERSKHGVQLTEAGRLLVEYARRICMTTGDAKLALKRFKGGQEAVLRICASTIPAVFLIPDLLGTFMDRYPGIRLEVRQGDSNEMLRALLHDEAELAVVGGRFLRDKLTFTAVGEEEIILVARSGYSLPGMISIEQLRHIPLIVREQGSGTRQALDHVLKGHGIDHGSLKIAAQLGSSEGIRRAVLRGAGLGFISSLAVADEVKDGRIAPVEVEGLSIRRSFYLAIRKGKALSPAAEAFVELLINRGQ